MVRVVAQADHDRLLATVRQAIQQHALGDLTPLLGPGQEIIPESIGIVEERPEWTAFSAAVGQEADTVSLTMRAIVQAVVIDRRMVNQAAFAGLAARIPPGQEIVPESISFTRESIEAIDQTGRVTFLANVTGDASTAIDIEQVQQALAGRSYNEVLTYLYQNLDLAPEAPPGIVIWPPFHDRMPLLPSRITVIVQEAS